MANSRRNKSNTHNAEHILFQKLTKLFSGPIANLDRQIGHQLRRRELVKYNFQNALQTGKSFKKIEYSPFENLNLKSMANQRRIERYADFDQMEFIGDIAATLDVYADEMMTYSSLQPLLNIKCSNEEIKEVLKTLYYNILNIEHNLYQWCRTMCKYGDYFLYLDIDEKMGIKNVIGLPPNEIDRIEGEDKLNPNYVQFQWNMAKLTLENWQIAHFRILGNDKFYPFGSSVLDPARRVFRQLLLLENAMLSYRIVRAPERRVFYIDVGNIAPQDVEGYMQEVITQLKRNQVIDPDSGRSDLRYNPQSIEEDFYIPTRGTTNNTRIETLPGGQYVGDIDDVKYMRDKLFSALKMPQSYISRGEGADEDKGSLAQKDLRFARTIQRLQKSIVSELEKIGIIHLYVLGYRNEDLLSFKLHLNNPSKISELQELEHWKTKFDVASSATEGFFSKRWISEKLFNMSEEDILRNQREMFYDRNLDKKLSDIEEGVESFGDIGGGDLGELGDLGSEEETPEDEGVLLAKPEDESAKEEVPPGRREDGYYTDNSKGKKYFPVKTDKRDSGARKRNFKSKYGYENSSSTKRNIFSGADELFSLGKGIQENITNYEEERVLKENYEVNQLIENMDKNLKKNE